MVHFADVFITGIMVGGIYACIALGWAIIFKTSGVINLATGQLTMIGGYVLFALYTFGMPIYIAFVGMLAIAIVLGILTERLWLRPMIGEPVLSVIMVTVGIAFAYQAIVALIWGADTRVFQPPVFPLEPLMLGPIHISQVFLYSFLIAGVMMALLIFFFQRTRMGLAMQATADDEMAARSMGIPASSVYRWTWVIAFMSCGIAGGLLGNINGLNISVSYMGLLVLPAVVIGGMNSIPGAVAGGLIIGVLENLGDAYISRYFPGGVKSTFPFFVMLIVMLWRPYGLWGWVKIERM
ncbi:MAG: branched-chain amino acid ABC transporter permease [Chloroflexi bacterium]|nr:branched-chain amino acid ABC transporter permease [Chloroflexota bacterium]MBM3173514.1 branched-chain amino acid ABC transporter permease [Chloroflexota bacterium]MBM4454006.1 branched-chain amino acid ABC transporter permease [Chloroflexota bacterium]